VIGTIGVTFRMVTMLWTGSAFLFFVQPVVATVATAAGFAVSALIGRPLAARLGADFVPLPATAWADPDVHRACVRLSGVWAVALLANAGLTMWMLSTLSVPTFVLLRPVVSLTTTVPAIAASVIVGRAVLRRCGARFDPPAVPAVVPVVAPALSLAVA
jgi:hypothetical protein